MFQSLFLNVHWVIHLVAVAIVLDAVTTIYSVQNKIGAEANPILKWFIKRLGFVPTIVISHIVMLGSLYYYAPRISFDQSLMLLGLAGGVTLWNTYGIFKHSQPK